MCDAEPAERGECKFHGFQHFGLEIQAPGMAAKGKLMGGYAVMGLGFRV